MIGQSLAFVLHRQNYGETSRILRCFTRDTGRVDMVCKGCRAAGKKGKSLEPLRLYRLEWVGKNDLKTLRSYDELDHYALHDQPERLYCAFYVNELASAVVRHDEGDSDLFELYQNTLMRLTQGPEKVSQSVLREFELGLLGSMGYGVDLAHELDGVTPIEPGLSYGYEPDQGLYRTQQSSRILANGDSILSLATGEYDDPRQEREAKQLMRTIIQYYFPNTSIQSRKLFA